MVGDGTFWRFLIFYSTLPAYLETGPNYPY